MMLIRDALLGTHRRIHTYTPHANLLTRSISNTEALERNQHAWPSITAPPHTETQGGGAGGGDGQPRCSWTQHHSDFSSVHISFVWQLKATQVGQLCGQYF